MFMPDEARALGVGALLTYNVACRAIAEAVRVDEVKVIRDKALAIKHYARQAKNLKLEADCVEIRLRATRRMDELRQEQAATVGLARAKQTSKGFKKNPLGPPTLAEAGIDKNLAQEGRRLGALSVRNFEKTVAEERERVMARASGSLAAKPARLGAIARCVKIVKLAVANAAKKAPRERVLKALWDEIGVPEDCGSGSAGELARKEAYIEQLEREVNLLQLKIIALKGNRT
jgi:hypothetical protein